jgi:hypothetical protein
MGLPANPFVVVNEMMSLFIDRNPDERKNQEHIIATAGELEESWTEHSLMVSNGIFFGSDV